MSGFIRDCKAELVRLGHDKAAVRDSVGMMEMGRDLWFAGMTGTAAAAVIHRAFLNGEVE